ncbi:MAG: glucose-1-phosphate adenylyltransferase [Bacilli bacterium]|jgi:glucose-1-phosphate adenylyltransferase|nr:glucose-1-phosphate adenylyltransferase [Bacilli bacterium]
MANGKMVAMLLAGGKGTRLRSLTRKLAKPAVFFGGKYRIIDFPLSNCANSGIDTVGVLTQYESTALNTYISNGSNWGIDGNKSLTVTLAPHQTEEGASWFKGTADAIFQNLDFLDQQDPDYVIILSGDHIYKMDYAKMLDFHVQNNADLTIACLNVSLEEAKRFGIMKADETFRIQSFAEKPKHPESTLASMGIYIFNYKVMKAELIKDSKDPNSENDFGKNIIPTMLGEGKRLFAYPFDGYWKDVGTVESLWEANMDLLDGKSTLNIYDSKFRIFSEDTRSVPQFIGPKAKVTNSIVNQGSKIYGQVSHSVIFNEVTIEEGAVVTDSVVMPDTIIKKGVHVTRSIIGTGLVIDEDKAPGKDDAPGSVYLEA